MDTLCLWMLYTIMTVCFLIDLMKKSQCFNLNLNYQMVELVPNQLQLSEYPFSFTHNWKYEACYQSKQVSKHRNKILI
jgi:hypothetical protein